MILSKSNFLKAMAAAAAISAVMSGCGDKTPENETSSVSLSEGDYTTADIEGILETAETTSAPAGETEEIASFATVTDVENEVDRAIYKTQLTLPEGWKIAQDTDQGKLYASNLSNLKIQATNYGADAELNDLDTLADGAAASIKIQNMYYQADTDFGEPTHTTVAGQDAVRYDYTVTAYIFDVDEEGNKTGEKSVFAEYMDRLYVLYNGTDAYFLQFETAKENYDMVSHEFDEIVESFSIAEDGTEGYQSASVFMSEYEEYSLSVLFSQLDEEADAKTASASESTSD